MKMRHILDYDILQEWGFVWAAQNDDGVVVVYATPDTWHTDMFFGKEIGLYLMPDNNTITKWHLCVLGDVPGGDLFRGVINSKEDLECILRCTLIFKPDEDSEV